MLSSPQFLTLLWVENRLCEGPVGVNGPAQPGLGCLRIPAWWQGGCGSWVAAWGCPMWTCWDFVLTRELLSGGASCRGYECGSQCLCGARGLGWQGRGQSASQPRVPPSLSLLRTPRGHDLPAGSESSLHGHTGFQESGSRGSRVSCWVSRHASCDFRAMEVALWFPAV